MYQLKLGVKIQKKKRKYSVKPDWLQKRKKNFVNQKTNQTTKYIARKKTTLIEEINIFTKTVILLGRITITEEREHKETERKINSTGESLKTSSRESKNSYKINGSSRRGN